MKDIVLTANLNLTFIDESTYRLDHEAAGVLGWVSSAADNSWMGRNVRDLIGTPGELTTAGQACAENAALALLVRMDYKTAEQAALHRR